MAAPGLDRETPEISVPLLPIFAVAIILSMGPIVLVGLAPSTLTLAFAVATVIGFAAAVSYLLGRMIGSDEH